MTFRCFHKSGFTSFLLTFLLLLCGTRARSQDAVFVLKAAREGAADAPAVTVGQTGEQAFDLHRNLIFFPALLDGRPGSFILDTGAPTLLLNGRAEIPAAASQTGFGTGGEVGYDHHRVGSLEFAGRRHGTVWALTLDLRALEARTGRSIDGFVGYEQLLNRELRIDYPGETFSVRRSERRPTHTGRAPDHVFDLDFDGHLPVVTLKLGKQKLRFILDTGAATNLLDPRYVPLSEPTSDRMSIQGIDGTDRDCPVVALPPVTDLILDAIQRRFVAMPLDHLCTDDRRPVAGILGATFLNPYCVGIDYRRGKLYLWKPAPGQ